MSCADKKDTPNDTSAKKGVDKFLTEICPLCCVSLTKKMRRMKTFRKGEIDKSLSEFVDFTGARGGSRTRTPLRALAPEASESTNSTTRAKGWGGAVSAQVIYYHAPDELSTPFSSKFRIVFLKYLWKIGGQSVTMGASNQTAI